LKEGNLFFTPIFEGKSIPYKFGYLLVITLDKLSSPYLLVGFSTIVLSAVFQEGIALKEEVELTI